MSASTAGVAAAAAAAAKASKEEEEMTKYRSDDLDGWEFKIMRSTWGHFGNREKFQKICEEEVAAGWEMVEKFDDHRVRFNPATHCSHFTWNASRSSVPNADSSALRPAGSSRSGFGLGTANPCPPNRSTTCSATRCTLAL